MHSHFTAIMQVNLLASATS